MRYYALDYACLGKKFSDELELFKKRECPEEDYEKKVHKNIVGFLTYPQLIEEYKKVEEKFNCFNNIMCKLGRDTCQIIQNERSQLNIKLNALKYEKDSRELLTNDINYEKIIQEYDSLAQRNIELWKINKRIPKRGTKGCEERYRNIQRMKDIENIGKEEIYISTKGVAA